MAADELGDNVAMFPGISPNKYDPEVMLKGALRVKLTEVIVIGWDEDGELFWELCI